MINVRHRLIIILFVVVVFFLSSCSTSSISNKESKIKDSNISEINHNKIAETVKQNQQNAASNAITTASSRSSSSDNNPSSTTKPAMPEASIHFLDTGNSDCIIIKQSETTIMIDGADSSDGSSIVSYLHSIGTTEIAAMINTHPDADHVGGLAEIMKAYKIQRLYVSNGNASTKTYRNFIETAGDLGLSPEVPLENSRFQFGNGFLTFYNTKAIGSNNELSLIVLYEHEDHRFLFTGDAGMEQEKTYVDILPDIDVLKVGHHGSSSSTSEQLLMSTKPENAVILVGSDNKYGHPHQETLNLLTKYKINIYRTDTDGTIIAKTSKDGISFQTKSNKVTTNQPIKQFMTTATSKMQTTSLQTTTQATASLITTSLVTTSKSTTLVPSTSIYTSKESVSHQIIRTPNGQEIAIDYVFKNCDEVKRYFPNGFSNSEYPDLYQYNQNRDGDKDGYACES